MRLRVSSGDLEVDEAFELEQLLVTLLGDLMMATALRLHHYPVKVTSQLLYYHSAFSQAQLGSL